MPKSHPNRLTPSKSPKTRAWHATGPYKLRTTASSHSYSHLRQIKGKPARKQDFPDRRLLTPGKPLGKPLSRLSSSWWACRVWSLLAAAVEMASPPTTFRAQVLQVPFWAVSIPALPCPESSGAPCGTLHNPSAVDLSFVVLL